MEEVALGLPLANGESLRLLLGLLDRDRVLLASSHRITLGLWLGWLEEVALGLPLANGESLRLLPGPLDGD